MVLLPTEKTILQKIDFKELHEKFSGIKTHMKQCFKLSAFNSLWHYYFGSTKPEKFENLSDVIESESAYLDETISKKEPLEF